MRRAWDNPPVMPPVRNSERGVAVGVTSQERAWPPVGGGRSRRRRRRVRAKRKIDATSPKSQTARAVVPPRRTRARQLNWRSRDVFGRCAVRSGDRRGRVAGCARERDGARLAGPAPGRRRDAEIARAPRVARRGAAGRRGGDTWHTAIEVSERRDIIRFDTEVPEMAPRTRRGVPGRSSATRERRRGFFGRATRRSSRACLGRVHADPRVSGEETLRVRCSPVRSRKSLRFGNHRAGRVRARASSASVVRASAGTHLAAEAMVMEEAILLTGESSECCDGR